MEYPDIFIIVGSGRCGTTHLQRMLRHSMDIGFYRVSQFVIPIYRKLEKFGDLKKSENLKRLVQAVYNAGEFGFLHKRDGIANYPDEILRLVQEPTYTGVLYAAFQLIAKKLDHSRLGYKFPGDLAHMHIIAELLPTARFIHPIRDGRDVAISFLKYRWGPKNLFTGSSYWSRMVSFGRRNGSKLGDRYFELKWEDLMLQQNNIGTQLGNYVNQGRKQGQVEELLGWIDRSKKPDRLNVWKHSISKKQRFICEVAAGKVLRECGYTTEFDHDISISAIRKMFYRGSDNFIRTKNVLLRKFINLNI